MSRLINDYEGMVADNIMDYGKTKYLAYFNTKKEIEKSRNNGGYK